MNNILSPPQSYIDFRCYTHGISGPELSTAAERFYKKRPEEKKEISQFFDWLEQQRSNFSLPYEKIEIKGKRLVKKVMIFDIEYWIEGGKIKQRKIYIANQGELSAGEKEDIAIPKDVYWGANDVKMRAAGEREPGEEG